MFGSKMCLWYEEGKRRELQAWGKGGFVTFGMTSMLPRQEKSMNSHLTPHSWGDLALAKGISYYRAGSKARMDSQPIEFLEFWRSSRRAIYACTNNEIMVHHKKFVVCDDIMFTRRSDKS